MSCKLNDLFVLDNVYCANKNIPGQVRQLRLPQKYLRLETDEGLFELELVSVDDYEFVFRVEREIL